MVDRDLPYRKIENAGNNYDDWCGFWKEQFATTQSKRTGQIVSYDLQTKATSFIALCESMLKSIRVYVLATGDQALLSRFEADAHFGSVSLRDKIISLRGKDRTNAIVEILAVATQSIELNFIMTKQSYAHRLFLAELGRAVEELELIGDGKVQSTLSPITISAAKPSGNSSSLTLRPSIPNQSVQVTRTQMRKVFGLALGSVVMLGLVRARMSAETTAPAGSPVEDHYQSHPSRREPLYRPAIFIRHTGNVVEPVRPHQSIVYPSLVRFLDANADQLYRCFSNNTVQITNVAALARWITDNPDHRVHTMLERLSRRPDKHFTVWWTDNCSEMVFATGVRTDFLAGEIRPQPVTLMLPVRE